MKFNSLIKSITTTPLEKDLGIQTLLAQPPQKDLEAVIKLAALAADLITATPNWPEKKNDEQLPFWAFDIGIIVGTPWRRAYVCRAAGERCLQVAIHISGHKIL